MQRGLDTGEIILQRALPIGPEEDFGSLETRLAALAAQAGREALDLIRQGRAPRLPQNDAEATYAPPLERDELTIDWTQPAVRLHGLVRALSPHPGARTRHQGKLLKVLATRLDHSPAAPAGVPGAVTEKSPQGLHVQTGNGSVLILRVQPEGRTPMSASDYALGHHLQVGQVLG
jgi:methionyl-tRNA formyltransferase